MRTLRQVILWTVLAAIALLAAVSIHGAFIGADPAKELFNSVPMTLYWFLFGLFLVSGFIFFRRLVTSPASLAVHLGSLLVLGGAMWGSDQGHDFAKEYMGGAKVAGGYMVVYEGQTVAQVLDNKTQQPIADLPFSMHLHDFDIEYYPIKDPAWRLFSVVPELDEHGHVTERTKQHLLASNEGAEFIVPGSSISLKILKHLPHVSEAWEAGAEPRVEITTPAGVTTTLPGRVDAEADLKEPAVKVRITRVFSNLLVQGSGAERQITDAPGEGSNPAVEVVTTAPDGAQRKRYLFAQFEAHSQSAEGLKMRYVLPAATGVKEDPDSETPALQVEVRLDDRQARAWLMARGGQPRARLALVPLLVGKREEETPGPPGPALFFVPPQPEISDYKSDLGVQVDGKEVLRKTIEVNDPLHYGGYHFYQQSYDNREGRFTVLGVVSDSGLDAVWIGFTLLVAGTFWKMWGQPAVKYLMGGGNARGTQ